MRSLPTVKKYRVYYIGLLIVIVWILLPVIVKAIFYNGMNVFHAPIETVASRAGEVQDYWALRMRSKNRLISDYRRANRSQAHLQMKLDEYESTQAYVNRLERLLSMNPIPGTRSIYARVIRRDINTWSESFKIDKGTKDGLKEGVAVVSTHHLIGRVSQVSKHTSIVTLISSPAFRITVNTANDERSIVYNGNGQKFWESVSGQAFHVPQDINANEKVRVSLYTSGLGGEIPAGIFIGELIFVEPELEGLFKKGRVRLSEDLRYIREVAVLIPLEQGN